MPVVTKRGRKCDEVRSRKSAGSGRDGVVVWLRASGCAHADLLGGSGQRHASAVQDNGTLATKNACSDKQRSPNCVGENVSPPLSWSGVPDGTKSFALLLFDPEGRAPAGVSHMVVYGIPASVKGFAEGELSKESDKFVGGKSTMEKNTYWGPGTPPNTDWHHYTWTLIATDLDPKAPELKAGMTREELAVALKDHVKGSAGLVTRFKHP